MTFLAQAGADGAATASALPEQILFWVMAVIGIGAGLAMVSMRNIVHSALMLVINFAAIAVLYLALQSSFLGIVQIIVYAGAIMILFLFVIMLLGVDRDDLLVEIRPAHRVGAALVALVIVAASVFSFVGAMTSEESRCGALAPATVSAESIPCVGLDDQLEENDGPVGLLARRLFTRYTWPFEISALLLVVATIGAIVLGRRRDPADEAARRALEPEPEPTGPPDLPPSAEPSPEVS